MRPYPAPYDAACLNTKPPRSWPAACSRPCFTLATACPASSTCIPFHLRVRDRTRNGLGAAYHSLRTSLQSVL